MEMLCTLKNLKMSERLNKKTGNEICRSAARRAVKNVSRGINLFRGKIKVPKTTKIEYLLTLLGNNLMFHVVKAATPAFVSL